MNGLLATLALTVSSMGASPEWISDYGQALEAARAANRPLLIVLDDPTRPEGQISQASVRNDTTQNTLLQQFILCHIDVTTGYGRRVVEAFGVGDFPYTVITDRAVKTIIYSRVGQFRSADWVTTLVRYQNGERRPSRVRSGRIGFQRRAVRSRPDPEVCFT